MKQKGTGLSDQEKVMFTDFMDWWNLEACVKETGSFDIRDAKFQSFLKEKNVTLDCKSSIPKAVAKANTIVYKSNGPHVIDLARHIRNAFAHSNIKKVKADFFIEDVYNKAITMRGRVSAALMQGLLNAIRENKRIRRIDNF